MPVKEDCADEVVYKGQNGDVERGSQGEDDWGEADKQTADDHGDDKKEGSEESFKNVVDYSLDESGKSFGQEAGVRSVLKGFKVLANVVPENQGLVTPFGIQKIR